MASAPVLGGSGKVDLDDAAFGARFNGPLVHESVRAELNARRRGTASTKTRGNVRGGGAKPWRQKGTGRARQGTIRAPQFKGGGHTFAKVPRTFIQKVNRKAHKAALRSALASHAQEGTLAVIDASQFDAPSTKKARAIVEAWGQQTPTVLVCLQEEQNLSKSFRNLERVAVIGPSEVEVGAVVWARSLLVSEAALPLVQGKAQ
jgi:large subunit ribosomal protein L4